MVGGFVGIICIEFVRDCWCLIYNEWVKFFEDIKEMFGIGIVKDGVVYKDLGKVRV